MPRTGRPLRLGSHVTSPQHGQPGEPGYRPERTLTVAERIYELMGDNGTRAELCGVDAGVDRRTVVAWMTAGARAEEKRFKGHLLTPKEQHVYDFLLNTRAAHARWVHRNITVLSQLAAGGLVVGKIVEEVDPSLPEIDPLSGQPVLDRDGKPRPKVIKRRIEQQRQAPSESSLRWLLERLARDEDGQRMFAQRVEVTGADGAPLAGDEDRTAREDRLAAELLAYAEGYNARQAEESSTGGKP